VVNLNTNGYVLCYYFHACRKTKKQMKKVQKSALQPQHGNKNERDRESGRLCLKKHVFLRQLLLLLIPNRKRRQFVLVAAD
jgi:hypothetical protein